MDRTILLVDFENVKDVDLVALPPESRVWIFAGKSQKSVPFELTRDAQRFGDRLEWVKIAGDGKNNLDFHLAWHLGRLTHEFPRADFVILSKDKGFDALINHLNQLKFKCRRVDRLQRKATVAPAGGTDSNFDRAMELLSKVENKKRPRKRTTLEHQISAYFQKKLPAPVLKRTVERFFEEGLIVERDNALSYQF